MALAHDAAALGWARVRAMRARCGLPGADRAAGPPPSIASPAADASLPDISGGYPVTPQLGLDVAGIPDAWLDALGWAGVPLARAGALRWGRDVRPGGVEALARAGAAVLVPTPERLRSCNGLQLKPLRLLVAERVGCRLQAGPGVHLFAWEAVAVLVSCRDIPLGGLLSGPRPGSRATVALEPGGTQVVRW